MSFCRLVPIFIVASAIVGGLIARLVGTNILYGVALGMCVGFSPLLLLALVVGLMHLWRPDHPQCLCGHRSYDYVATIRPNEDPRSWGYRYRCLHCGQNFVAGGHAFQVLDENGLRQPYMTHSDWGRWRPAGG